VVHEGGLMSSRDGQVRVKEWTLKAINILAGEIQQATGTNISADDAIWSLINDNRPDIANKALLVSRSKPRHAKEISQD
jgi:hypothetical protein